MPKKLKTIILSLTLMAFGAVLLTPAHSYALTSTQDAASSTTTNSPSSTTSSPLGNGCVGQTPQTCLKNNKIIARVNQIVSLLSALVALVVVGSIIYAGIQYSLAGDNPQKVGDARARITRSIVALITFLFIFAILQWLIPGGIFS
jgi:hypothetical protein